MSEKGGRAKRRIRVRSLRLRVLFALIIGISVPPLGVYVSIWMDTPNEVRVMSQIRYAGTRIGEKLKEMDLEEGTQLLFEMAEKHKAHVRVLREDGSIVFDEIGGPWLLGSWWEQAWVGNWRSRFSSQLEEVQPVVERAETQRAWNGESWDQCQSLADGQLRMCGYARRVEWLGASHVVHMQRMMPRPHRALFDVREQLLKLVLLLLPFGLLMGWWMGRSVVRPIELLGGEVRSRVRGQRLADPLVLERDDEVGDLAEAFNELVDQLETRRSEYRDFVADVAHEMKNPVAAIRVVAEGMVVAGDVEKERLHRYASVLLDGSKRLDALVSQFLELARAEAGFTGEERERFALDKLVQRVCARLTQQHPQVEWEVQADTPMIVHGVSYRIDSLVSNLLHNALGVVGENGAIRVHLSIHAWEGMVGSTVARLVIADNGPGLSAEDKEKVFDRFFSRREGGTGLGLALVKAITEAHHGRVWVESVMGEGAQFFVQIPIVGEAEVE